MNKPLIFIFVKDLSHWGQKHLIVELAKDYSIVLFHFMVIDELNLKYLENLDIKTVLYKQCKYLGYFEFFIRNFILPPKTTNFINSRRKQLAVDGKFVKALRNQIFFSIIPKVLNSTIAAKFLGSFKSRIDDLLIQYNPKLVLYISMFLPIYHPIFRAKKLGYKVVPIIYSWDNPYRDNFLPKHLDGYLVWNKEMGYDIERLHNISKFKQYIIGPFQFDYLGYPAEIDDFSWSIEDASFIEYINLNKDKYFLYLFAAGLSAVEQEIQLVAFIAEIISRNAPDFKLICRPYPNSSKDYSIYGKIESFNNVYVQRILGKSLHQTDQEVTLKKYLLKNCLAVINLGTTMCLEASILDKPIIQLNFLPNCIDYSKGFISRLSDLDKLLQNEHLKVYLNTKKFINEVTTPEELKHMIKLIISKDIFTLKYTNYLKKLVNYEKANPFTEIARDVIKTIVSNSNE